MNLDKLRNNVKKLNDKRDALVKAEGQKAIRSAFDEIFSKYPKLESLSWTQYTPYFVDGDACTFRVCDIDHMKWSGDKPVETDDDYEDDYIYFGGSEAKKRYGAKLCADVCALSDALQDLDDTMELIFGDHVQVTATREGFEVEEHDHD